MISSVIRSSGFLTLILAFSVEAAEVVGKIGGTEVTTTELRAYVETLPASDQAALAKDPSLLSQVVRTYLARQAVRKEAQLKKFDQQPAVKAQLDRVRDEAVTELYLQSVSRPPDGYPSDAEVQAAYDANRKAFEVPKQYQLAQVFLAAARGDREAEERGKKKLDEVQRRLKQKADFAAVARELSEEKDAAQRSGEIGWLAEEQMVPGIRATAVGLGKGAVSEPVRLDDGWHVLKLLDTRPPSVRPLAEVRETLVAELRAERARASRQAYLAKLLEQNPPAINELTLPKVVAKAK
jgi:parvulin-like peptidyl-prolyl isomerase